MWVLISWLTFFFLSWGLYFCPHLVNMDTSEIGEPFLRLLFNPATAFVLESYLYSPQLSSTSLTRGVIPVKRSSCLPANSCPWHLFLGRYETSPHNLSWQEHSCPKTCSYQRLNQGQLWLSLWSCLLLICSEDRLQASLLIVLP